MPLFLIPLAFSLLSAGAGIFAQVQENNRLESEGQQAVKDQVSQNDAARVNEYSTYVNTVDVINEEQAQLDAQSDSIHAQKRRLVTSGLFATAFLLVLLTVYLVIQRKV